MPRKLRGAHRRIGDRHRARPVLPDRPRLPISSWTLFPRGTNRERRKGRSGDPKCFGLLVPLRPRALAVIRISWPEGTCKQEIRRGTPTSISTPHSAERERAKARRTSSGRRPTGPLDRCVSAGCAFGRGEPRCWCVLGDQDVSPIQARGSLRQPTVSSGWESVRRAGRGLLCAFSKVHYRASRAASRGQAPTSRLNIGVSRESTP
jgi:hypothetical protein